MTLEDEGGIANLVVWPRLFKETRSIVMGAGLVGCVGRLQIEGKAPQQVVHVVAERLIDMTALLDTLREGDGPTLMAPTARADEVTRSSSRDSRQGKPAIVARSRDFH